MKKLLCLLGLHNWIKTSAFGDYCAEWKCCRCGRCGWSDHYFGDGSVYADKRGNE